MKHGSLISPDEAPFGFGTPKAVFETASAPAGDAAGFITIPDAHLLFSGEFRHSGNDLKITGDDGNSFLVTDYFRDDKRPTLRSPEGATLSGDLVDLLAGPLAPGQYAQAGAPQPGTAEAVGRVAVVTGNVTVIRNGVAITVNAGDAILKNDVVQTGAGATLGLTFNDGSTFNLTGNARLAINEFVYDPNGSANSSLVTLIQGAATFVAGQVAKTGDMKVATPVATMGIRGTAVMLDMNALDGRVTISIINERDSKEHIGEVFDRAGNLIATVTSNGGRLILTPTTTNDVIASFTNKTPEQVAIEFAAFQAVLTSYEAAKQFFPSLPDRADVSPKGTQSAGGSDFQPSNTTTGLPDSITQGQKLPDVVFTKAVESPGTGDGDNSTDDGTPTIVETVFTPPALNPINGSGNINGTEGADYITGSSGVDTINAMGGNDFVFAFDGDDEITAGHGGGNDSYDGGDDFDKITFHSTNNAITFDLVSITGLNTADNIDTGHDIFTKIERIESGGGDDVFILHSDANWVIDAGGGFDIVKLIAGLDIYGEDGPDISNFEMVDLTNGGGNIVEFEGGGIDEHNPGDELRIVGDSQDAAGKPRDIVKLTPGGADGHWEIVSDGRITDEELFGEDDHHSDGVTFDTYIFVDDYGCTLATAYIGKDITVATLVEDGAENKGTSSSSLQFAPEDDEVTYDLTDWTPTPFAANGHYYAFVAASGPSWSGAQGAAEEMDGYLANITSAAENDFIVGIIAGHVQNGSTAAYIGGARFAEPSVHWEWTNGAEHGQQFWQGGIDGTGTGYTNWRSGEPNNYGDNESILVMEGDGTWNDASADYGQSVGYVVEFDSMPDSDFYEIFSQFSLGGTYGYLTLDTDTNLLTYYLDNDDPDTQALTEGQTVTESFDVVFDDNDEPVTQTVEFTTAGANDAPVVHIDDAHTEETEDTTTLSGLFASDVDDGVNEIFHATVVAQRGTLAMADPEANEADEDISDSRMEFHASLTDINDALQDGITYTSPDYQEGLTDKVTLTIEDPNGGTDTINFIFNVFGDSDVTLTATEEKDVLFGTGYSDTFVFDHDVGPQGIGHDVITDFAPDDKIELVNFAYNDISELNISYNAEAQTASITLAQNETISLEQVTQPLTNNNFNFFHV